MNTSLESSWRWVLAAAMLFCSSIALGQTPAMRDWPVYVDDSPALQEMLEQARSLRQQNRLTEAAGMYQTIITQHAGKLARINDTTYQSAQMAVQQAILSDPPLLAAYQQLHTPEAQRALSQALDQNPADLLNLQEPSTSTLSQLVQTWFLTPAGLEAGLTLASLQLERARTSDARSLLQQLGEHPELATNQARWHWLQVIAGLIDQDEAHLQHHQAQLSALPGPAAAAMLAQLETWRSGWVPPQPPPARGPIRIQDAINLPKVFKTPLWWTPFGDAAEDTGLEPNQPGNLRREMQEDRNMQSVTQPLERQGVVYLNDLQRLTALDSSSGRVLWQVNTQEYDELRSRNLPFRAFQPDMRGVAIAGDKLAAVVGRSSISPGRMMGLATPVRLMVVSLDDGNVLHDIEASKLDDSLEGVNFHGTPILEQGRIYALARRSRMTGFHTEFVFAFDLESGKLLWRRHLASANAPMNQRAIRPLGQMTLDRGRLYIADNLGAVSCVDASTGQVHWLNQGPGMPTALEAALGRIAPPSVLMGCPPVLVEQGLLISAATPSQPTILLDPQTGKMTRELDKTLWSQGDYLIKAGNDVYSIGQSVQRFDGRTLARKWGVALNGSGKVTLSGLAAVTKDHLLLPVNNRLVVLRLDTGSMVMQPELSQTGSVLALEGQVLVADQNRVSSYMRWEDAYARLSAQVKEQPTNPQPAMALAHLAGESGQPGAMVQAVDWALAALQQRIAMHGIANDQQRREVFEQILQLARTGQGKSPASRRELYDRLAVATSNLGDEVTYHLMFGDFLVEMKDYHQAVDQYQAILNDEAMSQQLYTRDNLSRQGGLEARVRLNKMIEKYSLDVYRKHEIIAAEQLLSLTRPGADTDPQELVRLARQYPVSRSAGPALIAAANRLISQNKPDEALTQLRAAYELSNEAGVLQKAIGRIVELHLDQQQPQQARTWLMLARRRGIAPLREGKPLHAQTWLAEIQDEPGLRLTLPSWTLPLTQPQVIEAALLTPTHQPRAHWPGDMLITRSSKHLQLRVAPSWTARWEMPLADDGEVDMLWLSQDQALFWFKGSRRLIAADARTGENLWLPVDVMAILQELGGAEQKWAARPAERRQFEQWMDAGGVVFRNGRLEVAGSRPREGIMLAINDLVIVAVDGIGRAVGIDRQSGKALWSRILPLDQVSLLAIDDQTLAAAGINGVRVGVEGGALLLLDPMTGQARLDSPIEDKRPINFVALGNQDTVFFSTGQELVAHHIQHGQLLWRLPTQDKTLTGVGSVGEKALLMQDSEGALWIIDTVSGQLRSRVNFPAVQNITTLIQSIEDTWHVATSSQAASIHNDGQIAWRDGFGQLPGQSMVAQWVGQNHVAILRQNQTPAAPILLVPGGGNINRRRLVIPPPGQLRGNVNIQAENAPPANAQQAGDESQAMELLFLDRLTGKAILRQRIDLQGRSWLPQQSLTLDHALVMGDAAITIILPDASAPAP